MIGADADCSYTQMPNHGLGRNNIAGSTPSTITDLTDTIPAPTRHIASLEQCASMGTTCGNCNDVIQPRHKHSGRIGGNITSHGTHTKLPTIIISPTTHITTALKYTGMIIAGSNCDYICHIGNQLGTCDIGSFTDGTHTDLAILIPPPTVDLPALRQRTRMIKPQTNVSNTTQTRNSGWDRQARADIANP